MSGPFKNTIQQLVEQLNWLNTDEKMTWSNIRYGSDGAAINSGTKFVTFSSPFPREIIGFCASVGFDGGVRNWNVGYTAVQLDGFRVGLVLDDNWGFGPWPVDGTAVGIYYIAFGR